MMNAIKSFVRGWQGKQKMQTRKYFSLGNVLMSVQSWTTLEEDYKAFLLPAPKCTNCNKLVLMLGLSKTDT
jgi:hypothetical protein